VLRPNIAIDLGSQVMGVAPIIKWLRFIERNTFYFNNQSRTIAMKGTVE
jgi:hypothetical protein